MNFLKKILPWIGAAATGNVPALVNMAATEVGKALGTKVEATSEAITAAVAGATPEQLLALKQADNDFALKMRQLTNDEVKTARDFELQILTVDAQDRASARAREVSLRDKFVPILATVVLGSFIAAVLAILRGWGKVEAAFAGTLIGYLAANANQVVSYYFGSSAGSAQKTELLAKAPPVENQ